MGSIPIVNYLTLMGAVLSQDGEALAWEETNNELAKSRKRNHTAEGYEEK